MTPDETWRASFEPTTASDASDIAVSAEELQGRSELFMPSRRPASEEILKLLRENEADTITIVALGPLTNLAIAAAADPEAFTRAHEVVVMGGTIHENGNITPVAEFNTFADSVAAARVYALTSPNPQSTMPPAPPQAAPDRAATYLLAPYPAKLSRRLRVALFPLDITHQHSLTRGQFRQFSSPLVQAQSPLAEWMSAFVHKTFDKIESLQTSVSGDAVKFELHDPLCLWYCVDSRSASGAAGRWVFTENEDIRVETAGQWTRGQCLVDRRSRRRRAEGDDGERPGDTGNWLSGASGNRLRQCTGTPGPQVFGEVMLKRIFDS